MAYDFPNAPASGDSVTTPAGATFVWDGVKWGAVASMKEPVGAGTWGRLATAAWQRSVATAGDTMTGPLTLTTGWTSINADGAIVTTTRVQGIAGLDTDKEVVVGKNGQTWPRIRINGAVGDRELTYQTDGQNRWSVTTQGSGETGANAGSNFDIRRYTDGSIMIDAPISISRATGVVDFIVPPTVAGVPMGGVPLVEPVGPGTWGRLSTGAWERTVAIAGDTMTGNLTLNTTWPTILMQGPATSDRNITFATGILNRWSISGGSVTAESGGDAGSDFLISRFNDAGVWLDSPLTIVRATGVANFARHPTVAGAYPYVLKTGDTMTGNLTINNPAGSALMLTRPAGAFNVIQGNTAGVVRWSMALGDGAAESGANAGSNFGLFRYDDAGGALPNAITINRATGITDFAAPPTVAGAPLPYVLKAGDTMTGNLIINTGWPALLLQGPAASAREIYFQTGALNRFTMGVNSVAESGGNAGSAFAINAFDDANVWLRTALAIDRATGLTTLGGRLISYDSITIIGTGANYAALSLDATAAPAAGQIGGARNNSLRWMVQMPDTSAETGGNVGGDFGIHRCDDNGVYIQEAFRIKRSTGEVTMRGNVGVSGGISSGAAIYAANTVYGALGVFADNMAGQFGFTMDAGSGNTLRRFSWDGAAVTMDYYNTTNGLRTWTNWGNTVNIFTLAVDGTLSITGNAFRPGGGPWTATSDRRMKDIDGDYEHGLTEICALQPVRYHYKPDIRTLDTDATPKDDVEATPKFMYPREIAAKEFIGLVAQDVEPYLPECVGLSAQSIVVEDTTIADMQTLDTGPIIMAMINAFKEITARLLAVEVALKPK